MATLAEWLAEFKCGEVLQALADEGADAPADLLHLEKADLDRVLAPLKTIPRNKLLKALDKFRDSDAVRPMPMRVVCNRSSSPLYGTHQILPPPAFFPTCTATAAAGRRGL